MIACFPHALDTFPAVVEVTGDLKAGFIEPANLMRTGR